MEDLLEFVLSFVGNVLLPLLEVIADGWLDVLQVPDTPTTRILLGLLIFFIGGLIWRECWAF